MSPEEYRIYIMKMLNRIQNEETLKRIYNYTNNRFVRCNPAPIEGKDYNAAVCEIMQNADENFRRIVYIISLVMSAEKC